jgi:hypothetical protein
LGTWLAVLAGVGAWWVSAGTPGLPPFADTFAPTALGDQRSSATVAAPGANVVALADEAHLSAEGRELFYGTHPELLDAASFTGRCDDGRAAQPAPSGGIVGCYQPETNAIIIYAPTDPRLHGFVVETAGHETLHAGWDQLTSEEQTALTTLLEAEVGALPADDPIHAQIAASVGEHPENRPTELFAYVGTQVWRDGGLDPSLEATWGRFVADRAALVAVHAGWMSMLDQMRLDIEAAYLALNDQMFANATARAQYDADTSAAAVYRQSYDTLVTELASKTAEERAQTTLGWTWWDGTELPMAPADETLASAAALLDRDATQLPERGAAVQAAEDAATSERTRIDALAADFQTLQLQLDPGTATG